jgi:hypothetical protein
MGAKQPVVSRYAYVNYLRYTNEERLWSSFPGLIFRIVHIQSTCIRALISYMHTDVQAAM